jgi:hypothetical protein
MNMASQLLFQRTPVDKKNIHLGQLLQWPSFPPHHGLSFFSDSTLPQLVQQTEQPNYKIHLILNREGQLVLCDQQNLPADQAITLQAEQAMFHSLPDALQIFKDICDTAETQSWILDSLPLNNTLYFVTGVQELQNAKTEIDASNETYVSSSMMHTRKDSSMDVTEPGNSGIYGIQLREVRCRVGTPEEPHHVDDVGYTWMYYSIEDGKQLCVGLGGIYGTEKNQEPDDVEADADYSEDDGWW